MAVAPEPQTKMVPIYFEGQVVPGVMGEVYYDDKPLFPGHRPSMEWKITVNHVLNIAPQIMAAIRALPGVVIAPNEGIRVLPGQPDRSSYLEYQRYVPTRGGGKRTRRKSRKAKKAGRKTNRRHGRR